MKLRKFQLTITGAVLFGLVALMGCSKSDTAESSSAPPTPEQGKTAPQGGNAGQRMPRGSEDTSK